MNRLLRVAAVLEAATGVALVAVPSLVARLLFGVEISGLAVVLARIAGIGLLSLGLACWPSREPTRPASIAMLTYNLLVAAYLLSVGILGEWVGVLLWPVTVLHAGMSMFLARAALNARSAKR
jgi:hypothetical protein